MTARLPIELPNETASISCTYSVGARARHVGEHRAMTPAREDKIWKIINPLLAVWSTITNICSLVCSK